MKLGVEAIHYNTLCVAPDLQDMVILYILLVCPREHIIEVWPGRGCDLFGTTYLHPFCHELFLVLFRGTISSTSLKL